MTYSFSENIGVSADLESESLRWILDDGTVLAPATKVRILGGPFSIPSGGKVAIVDNIYLPLPVAEIAQQHGTSEVELELAFKGTNAQKRQIVIKAILTVEIIKE